MNRKLEFKAYIIVKLYKMKCSITHSKTLPYMNRPITYALVCQDSLC